MGKWAKYTPPQIKKVTKNIESSTSYITDDHANITQFDAYLPYGELLVDEHSSSEDMPYKFNGKELDEETGLYYYGARYMDPKISMWLGVDPLMEKYTNVSGYVYCHSNPIVRIDRDGCADYFSISGKFIRSDKSKDKNTCTLSNKSAQLDLQLSLGF